MKIGKASSLDFSNIAEDFRNLDPQDPAAWPLIPRIVSLIGIVAVVLLAAWWFVWSNQWDDLDSKQREEIKLKEDWVRKKTRAVNLDLLRNQLKEVDEQFGTLLKQLPNKAEMDALLQDINKIGLEGGLQFELFKPGADKLHDFYVEMPVAIKVLGAFHELGEFAGGTAQMPRIVSLTDMAIEKDPQSDLLVMQGNVVTYRYFDEEELKQRAQQNKAKGRRQ